MKPEIYFLRYAEQEAHFFGDMVAVCWNLEANPEYICSEDLECLKERKSDDPHISFYRNPEDNEDQNNPGWHFVDEDGPLDGGLGIKDSRQLERELIAANLYIELRGWET